ncbi:Com family DNA-binding transcriptional regulator [Candidatus Magnetaquiglobus chichijimensis]|uniref:Com family DNA-binding transcriptional regulator n=1 Tax=Candidatus Magnetaquiglobus chichijimensis TaxID=3141448 RepID=UPI003B976727
MLEELRCGQCGRLLAKGAGTRVEIKCPKCKTLNHFSGQEPRQTERQRALSSGSKNEHTDQKPACRLDGRKVSAFTNHCPPHS